MRTVAKVMTRVSYRVLAPRAQRAASFLKRPDKRKRAGRLAPPCLSLAGQSLSGGRPVAGTLRT